MSSIIHTFKSSQDYVMIVSYAFRCTYTIRKVREYHGDQAIIDPRKKNLIEYLKKALVKLSQ